VRNPLGTLFRELKRSEEALRASRDSVRREVEARTAELRESLELQRGILSAAMDGIWVVDGDGRVLEVNDAACRMLGYAREELAGASISALDAHEDPQVVAAHLARMRTLGFEHYETLHRRKDGVLVPVEISGALLPGRGAAVFIARDITRRRLAEAERATLQAQFHHAQKLESLGSLAGGVAHDINNVLAAISALAAVHGARAEAGGRLARDMGTIAQACARGGKLVGGLLAFSRRSPREDRPFALGDVVGEVAALLASTTLQKVQLKTDLEPGLPPVRGDRAALAHALTNLCVNAVDAMPGGGTLAIRTRRDGAGWVRLEVEDTGTGMPPEVLERALDPFFTTKDVGKGTGLGLAIVHSTVQAHGGELSLQSRPGAGTTVTLRLPPAPGDVLPAPEGAALEAGVRALQVLLVDDDDLILASVPQLLGLLGHEALTFQRAEDALRALDGGLQADVAVMDLHMPGMGGGELLPLIRERRPGLPILLVTGKADQGALDLVAAHEGVRLLSKPFGREELERALRLAVS
ncbi:MAG TPA: ATP-binding protein, partial [Holophaga sp.]|nr:ATP-binding protein [Holophaga sp.]